MSSNRGRGVSILFHSCLESYRQEHSSFAPKATSTLRYQLRLAGPSLVQPCQPIHPLSIVMYLPCPDSNTPLTHLTGTSRTPPHDRDRCRNENCCPFSVCSRCFEGIVNRIS